MLARLARRGRGRANHPLGKQIDASFALLSDDETAIVEVAAASGLALVAPCERDAEAASSGTGELIGPQSPRAHRMCS